MPSAPTFEHRAVRELPVDPDLRNTPRPVPRACLSRVTPTPVAAPTLLAWVGEVAALLGLPPAPDDAWVAVLAGNRLFPGMEPYAAAYGGHQFGNWAGQLGDGRAITLGELSTPGGVWELQLKGAGPTPYSRRGDGRAVLRSSVRELVCSEAMHHLGVPTTRALSLVGTGEPVLRDMFYDGRAAYEPGAVVCRVAPSFLRFGNFELHAFYDQVDILRRLLDFTTTTLFPELGPPGETTVVPLFQEVCRRTAVLVAHWMRVGFVHGVLNTDNMSILGLTLDYGPYGWIEPFDLDWTPNTTDAGGRRYRFGAQPEIGLWNLARLADAWMRVTPDRAGLVRGLQVYQTTFRDVWAGMLRQKLGLEGADRSAQPLVDRLFGLFEGVEVDMTLFFRGLGRLAPGGAAARALVAETTYGDPGPAQTEALLDWLRAWVELGDLPTRQASMNQVNPFIVPRNWQVQLAIDAAAAGDVAPLHTLLRALRTPYDETPDTRPFAERRPDWARDRAGCSMLSCSS